jgi:hypothetical protein
MKTKAALKVQHEYAKQFNKVLAEMLKGETGDKLVTMVTDALHGENQGIGDTGWHRAREVADDARKQVIEALGKMKAPMAKLSDEKLREVQVACRKTMEHRRDGEGRAYERKGGRFVYEIVIGGERIDEFASTGLDAAKKFAKRLDLPKHEVKRLTKREMRSRSVAFATSPTSEAYHCS